MELTSFKVVGKLKTRGILVNVGRKLDVINSQAMRNHIKLGIFLRVLYCVVDTGYGHGRSLGDCRPALPKGGKYQMNCSLQKDFIPSCHPIYYST